MPPDVPHAAAQFALPSFREVVENVQEGRPEGLEQLYGVLKRLSKSLRRQCGFHDFDDRLHDAFIVAAEAIQGGRLREANALSAYLHSVFRLSFLECVTTEHRHRQLLPSITRRRVQAPDPLAVLIGRERERVLAELMAGLRARDREILTRFYHLEQGADQIRREMRLTPTQYRLYKSRAKQRLATLAAARIQRSPT